MILQVGDVDPANRPTTAEQSPIHQTSQEILPWLPVLYECNTKSEKYLRVSDSGNEL